LHFRVFFTATKRVDFARQVQALAGFFYSCSRLTRERHGSMRRVINTYLLLRSQGLTRRAAIAEIYRALDELLTLHVALRVHEQNMRNRRDR
jgi:hypothetical protein